MANFNSKEDIVGEISLLINQLNKGKLSMEQLVSLVALSRELHERSVILRYKAFEEKIFGVRPEEVVESIEVPVDENEASEEVEAAVLSEETIEEIIVEEEITEVHVSTSEEPVFGFDLFGLTEEEEPSVEITPVADHSSAEEEVAIELLEENAEVAEIEEESTFTADSQGQELEEIEEEEAFFDVNLEEDTVSESTLEIDPEEDKEVVSDRPLSAIEQMHAENMARLFARRKEAAENEAVQPSWMDNEPMETRSEPMESPQASNEVEVKIEEIEEEITLRSESVFEMEEEENFESTASYREESLDNASYTVEEHVEELVNSEIEETVDSSALAVFIHKFNQVDSNLSSQFGIAKIESLIGSFGLNERLQFINELFDGSSEGFSNAIKSLDQQSNLELARTKIAELAVENQWDVESETTTEFMQKVARRYA